MSHQFKPGDPALVIGGEAFLGHQVEILHWVNPGDEVKSSKGHILRLTPDALCGGWLVECGHRRSVKLGKNLMPLRGDFAPEQQKAKEAEPCA